MNNNRCTSSIMLLNTVIKFEIAKKIGENFKIFSNSQIGMLKNRLI